jgi:polar amino acid transport system substrate-binding protein
MFGRIGYHHIFCLFSVAFLLTISVNICAEETVRIASGEWPPYFSEELKHDGVASHIAVEAFALEGIKVEFGWFPWKRSLRYAQIGKWDATIGWAKTLERENYLLFSEPILNGTIVFFHLKSFDFDWKTLDDLKDIKIGSILGFDYNDEFIEAEKKGRIKVSRVSTDEQNFQMLLLGRIQVYICNLDVGYSVLNKTFSSEQIRLITYHLEPFYKNELRIGFSNENEKSKRLLNLFNKGLKRLKDSGKFEKFYEYSRRGEYEPNK